MQAKLKELGLKLDEVSGHIFYAENFNPMHLTFELVFVRHGETYGNCGQTNDKAEINFDLVEQGAKDHHKRVFQGNVDTVINQLTAHGKKQAEDAALALKKDFLEKGWIPNVIFHSPLQRARDTGLPFVQQNNFDDRYINMPEIRELSFGAWDNRRVCDIDAANPCHQFYLNQNTVVKESGFDANNVEHQAENFCDVILRAHATLEKLNQEFVGKKILMFSHSMFGAACYILLGKGQKIVNGEYLAFDGLKPDGSPYTLPNARPVALNFNPEHSAKELYLRS